MEKQLNTLNGFENQKSKGFNWRFNKTRIETSDKVQG